jgi:two-component sensor histidine kinase
VLNRVDDLSTMVDDMLDISKLEAGVLGVWRRDCRVEDIIKNVQTTLERKALVGKVSLDVTLDDALPSIYCDPKKIGRVIINLTVNALKFANEGGHVHVWARRDRNESQLLIGVTDDGRGIAPEHLQAIFERFMQVEGNVRASTKGFGLGLHIAKELVHLNLGEITVASELGQGSTFSFTVPIAEPTSLLTRYFKRIGPPSVALLCVTVDPTVDPALLDDVEQLLQHQLRRDDLLFRAEPRKWLVVAATMEQELGTMISRLEHAWVEANRNRPSRDLPVIALEAKDTCQGLDQSAEFIRSFEAEYRAAELYQA